MFSKQFGVLDERPECTAAVLLNATCHFSLQLRVRSKRLQQRSVQFPLFGKEMVYGLPDRSRLFMADHKRAMCSAVAFTVAFITSFVTSCHFVQRPSGSLSIRSASSRHQPYVELHRFDPFSLVTGDSSSPVPLLIVSCC